MIPMMCSKKLLGIMLLAASLVAGSARAEVLYEENFTGDAPKSTWRYFEGDWTIETYQGTAGLVASVGGKEWLPRMTVGFRPNDPQAATLPMVISFKAVVFANNSDSNRFGISFYMDENGKASLYTAMLRPGGVAEIFREGGGDPVSLGKGTDPVTFPEGAAVPVDFIWGKDGYLEIRVDGQSIARSSEPVPQNPAPFALCFWERFGGQDPVNRAIFQNVTIHTDLPK